jgi:hypothetical protein
MYVGDGNDAFDTVYACVIRSAGGRAGENQDQQQETAVKCA